MSTTINQPSTQAQWLSAGLAKSFELRNALELALMDGLDTLPSMGQAIDLTGMNTTAMRMPYASGIGVSKRMTASGGETSINAASTYDVGYSAVSVGQYDLAYTQSVQNQVIGGDGTVLTLDMLKEMLPANAIATLRYLYCTAGSGISVTTVGSGSSANLDADDMYDLAAAITSRLGSGRLGKPVATLDPEQWNHARAAFRSEPAYVQNLGGFLGVQAAKQDQMLGDPLGLGFDIQITDDVVQDSGAYKGFCVSAGAIRRVKADPSRARIPAAASPIFLPDFGIVVYDLLDGLGSARLGWQALGFMGAALANSDVSLQILVTSKI